MSNWRPKSASFGKPRGLTLLELLVVITLLALVTATVTVRLGDRLQQATLAQSLSQWEFTDGQLRNRAQRAGRPLSLHLEIGSGLLECAFDPEDETARNVRELGRGVYVGKFITATREVSHGPVVIGYSDRGTTETFAVELVGGSERRWILTAGITGQTSEVADEREARSQLEMLIPAGVHAG